MSVSSDLDKAFEKKVTQAISDGMTAAVIELNSNLALETPVDTGAAHWNWIPSIGLPSGDIVASRGEVSSAAGSGSAQRAETVLTGYNVLMDGDIWISNNLPYIGELNNGSSQQADAGFVDALVSNTGEKIKTLVRLKNERS